ncbi:MAG: RDD family protein [Leptolyngbyaceae cyanobacterium RU_5_1]|nr:RDD family protein [Leptolyngbyaceae cyanobacterium RU_5_1]
MRFLNRISQSTPESVELEFTLAGIGNRILAWVIDYHVLIVLYGLFWLLWILFATGLLKYLETLEGDYSSVYLWLLAIGILISFVIESGYFLVFEVVWRGQTVGKRVARIRVIQDDGRPVRLAQAALRSLLRPIDNFCFIGAFFILFGKREKRIGDWAAGTIVIQEERGDRATTLQISDPAKQLATKLPELADLNQLLPDDYAVIREYLQRRGKMSRKARNEKSMELARQLRALIALETIPPDTTSDHFLEAVYLAYQQQAGNGE